MDLERPGDAEYSRHPGTALGTLDETDVIAVKTRQLRQFFLAEPLQIPVAADFVPQRQEVFFFILHIGSVASRRKTLYLLAVSRMFLLDLRMTMPRAKPRNGIDESVGARVRARRKARSMNQTELAKKLGVTFQMVQRYEYGLCRISASTLFHIAHALETPIDYFFEDLPAPTNRKVEPSPAIASTLELIKTSAGRTLAVLFPRIAHRGTQRAIVELVRAMVGEGHTV